MTRRKMKLKDLPVNKLRRRFGNYLDRVGKGEMFSILRRGKRVAMLVPPGIYERLLSRFGADGPEKASGLSNPLGG